MAYVDQQGLTRNKLIALIISLSIVSGVGLAMVLGLSISKVQELAERVTTVDVEEEEEEPEEEEPPPPPPEEVTTPPPVVPPVPNPLSDNTPFEDTTQDPIDDDRVVEEIQDNDGPVANDPPPPPPPPPPEPDLSAPATPRNQGRWAGQISNNYPSRALRREVEGTVGVSVTIGTNGRVSGCSVTRSSGSSILDDAACKGMRRYSRFNPAKGKDGSPTTGSFRTSITYRLN